MCHEVRGHNLGCGFFLHACTRNKRHSALPQSTLGRMGDGGDGGTAKNLHIRYRGGGKGKGAQGAHRFLEKVLIHAVESPKVISHYSEVRKLQLTKRGVDL